MYKVYPMGQGLSKCWQVPVNHKSNSQRREVPFEGGHEVEVSWALELTGRHCDGVVVQVQH